MITALMRRSALFLMGMVLLMPAQPMLSMEADQSSGTGSSWYTKLLVVSVLPVLGYGYLYRKHYNQFHALEQRLDRSTIYATAKERNFLFATWRSAQENTPDVKPWKQACDIAKAGEDLAKVFYNDAKNHADRIYIYDALDVRIEPQNIQTLHVASAIAAEKQWFEDQMAFVAQFTDAPSVIVQKLAPDDARSLSAHELALGCAVQLKTSSDVGIEQLKDAVNEQMQTASTLKSVVYCDGWLPTSWSIAPCYAQASRVYLKLFLAYARLCALDAVWKQQGNGFNNLTF